MQVSGCGVAHSRGVQFKSIRMQTEGISFLLVFSVILLYSQTHDYGVRVAR